MGLISQLPLKTLKLVDLRVNQISELSRITTLKTLFLRSCPLSDSLHLSSLECLTLTGYKGLDLNSLPQTIELKQLSLNSCNNITGHRRYDQLIKLFICLSEIDDLSSLLMEQLEFHKLETLDLTGSFFKKTDVPYRLPDSLKQLNLHNCTFKNSEFSNFFELESFKNLECLTLPNGTQKNQKEIEEWICVQRSSENLLSFI